MEKNLVYLIWTDIKTGNKYKVAELYKIDNAFYFKYIIKNVKEAEKNGFKLLIAFPKINALYDNPKLFATFAARSIVSIFFGKLYKNFYPSKLLYK